MYVEPSVFPLQLLAISFSQSDTHLLAGSAAQFSGSGLVFVGTSNPDPRVVIGAPFHYVQVFQFLSTQFLLQLMPVHSPLLPCSGSKHLQSRKFLTFPRIHPSPSRAPTTALFASLMFGQILAFIRSTNLAMNFAVFLQITLGSSLPQPL
jgi:hypothetical protein